LQLARIVQLVFLEQDTWMSVAVEGTFGIC
jgi:hypothetical protein